MKKTIEKRLSLMSEDEMRNVLEIITKLCQKKDVENATSDYYRGMCAGCNIQKKVILQFILEQH